MTEFFKRFTGEGDNLESLHDFINSKFFGLNRPALSSREIGWQPPTDMYETDDEIVVVAEIAGIEDKDVSLVLDNDLLLIRGIRREAREQKKRHYHDMEIEYGPFIKTMKLPSPVESDTVSAVYRGGFLEIRLRKTSGSGSRVEIKIS